MKYHIITSLIIIAVLTLSVNLSYSKDTTQDIIFKAMKDELSRNLDNISLKDLKKPFFISYTIIDGKKLDISSVLGSIVHSKEEPYRTGDVKVMVGSYKSNDDNFLDMTFGGDFFNSMPESLPLEDDYYGIRRALWISTDNKYKAAAEKYEKKLSAINQQNLTAEDSLDDFCRVSISKLKIESSTTELDKRKWEIVTKKLSEIFSKYNKIFSSEVLFTNYQAKVYFVNSEGTENLYPISLCGIHVNASTQAEDGENLKDFITFIALNPAELPDINTMVEQVEEMADGLIKLSVAPKFDESYSGPVLFEDQAVGEILVQRLFSEQDGLIASRKPIVSERKVFSMMNMSGKSLEDKVDKKLISQDITVKSTPKSMQWDGKNLIGAFQVDAEGVEPVDELILIEDGVLKNLLNGRKPTLKFKVSNGYSRIAPSMFGLTQSIAPGVVLVETKNSTESKNLRIKLIEKAKEEGLDFAYIVRKLFTATTSNNDDMDINMITSSISGGGKDGELSKPLAIYRVNIKNGDEELIRGAELGGLTFNSLKKILGTSNEKMVYNTLLSSGGFGGIGRIIFLISDFNGSQFNGIPVSIIHPKSILVEELDIKKEKRPITKKLPVVDNPVGK